MKLTSVATGMLAMANITSAATCFEFPTPVSSHCKATDGKLVWQFEAAFLCTPGMVTSSWWEATRNKFGALEICETLTRVS
ncbi:hypothetical protein CTA2_1176 [Colletotrichum tanaceti]|uniref:Uncharacterized protein n=1 Tax=Colletotrichum tanaceti TaxID=1306861 RepID=A0A4U6XQ16_9PEZI|nr:hypothetical protein CTA2_1176 [Colletotrichum tanaceti]TKW57872.1 hypothetical protein CTA1_8342 [Colletotrichum tanaceti]